MQSKGAFDKAADAAKQQARLAHESLARLPESDYRRLLEAVVELVISRKS
jgi:geranylgeranyl pyrophosphate synthase